MKSNETATGGCFRQWLLPFVLVAVLLVQISAGATQDDDTPSSEQWIAIDAYNEAMQAYWTKQSEIRNADIPDEERERLRQEFGLPDSAPAIAAAIAIMQSDGERLADAAGFLMGQARPSEDEQQSILDAVASHIGPDWVLVEDYIKSQAAFLETYDADIVKRPTWHAVAAARAIIESNHERSLEAAEFLVQQTYSLNPGSVGVALSSWWLPPSRSLGEATLSKLIGSDWNVVRNYLDELNAWQNEEKAIRESDLDEEDKARRVKELGEAPNPYRAAVASLAIIDLGGSHEKTLEAAEFLLDHPTRGGAARALRGAETLAAHFPDYDQWPLRLKQVNGLSSAYGPARSFVIDLSETLDDPLAQATARYFAASFLIQSANNPQLSTDERIAQQEKAEELANGLSAGIEGETFVLAKQSDDGTEIPMTFADAEAELFYSLDSTMVGSVVSDVTGRRVDGTEDTLAAYAGRVVLVDFWATWCGPCKDAFPKLRKMVEEFPEDRFQIIGVSVDEELDTVLDYLADEPLEWVVWHVGNESELVRRWRVTGYPTYVLVGPDGTIINKHPGAFNAGFRAEIEQAVQDAGAAENDALSSTDPSKQHVAMRPESSAVVGSSWWLRPSRELGKAALERSVGRD